MYKGNALDYFPVSEAMPAPRKSQSLVINEIDKVFKSGKKFIILEAPVGSGKSGIAMAFARAFNDSHIITPRKSLQDQYFEDFSSDVVLMKGRGGYPCTYGSTRQKYIQVIQDIHNGQVKQPGYGEANCATAPCRDSKPTYSMCVSNHGECPYTVAMQTAQENTNVIHNIHSFIFQTNFASKFEKRSLLVIDEAHDIEDVLREFVSKKFTLNKVIKEEDRPQNNDIDTWCDFFLHPDFVPKTVGADKARKEQDPDWKSPAEEYIEKVQTFRAAKTYYQDKFIVKTTVNKVGVKEISTTFEFVPESLGTVAEKYMFSFGDYVILMSGTIYGKDFYCRTLGIRPEDAHFIRIPSAFPIESRPIILKPEYQVDTSFANWNDNFGELIEKIEKVMKIFGDAKGLIHAPSYDSAEQIVLALSGNRAVTHGKQDFQDKLKDFYADKEPKVFVTPVCQQGVDFKGDRARFQIIVRIPYLNTSDEFVNHKVKNDFSWYNYKALVVFGQQLGRVNRSENDYGATFLMDSRFNKFVTRNSGVIPKWVQNAYVWK
jgi:ATP-dependent DNA helicase DinG